MDTAEHMFAKSQKLIADLPPTAKENLADLLYEIGKNASTQQNYEMAIRWLERAFDVLEQQDLGMLSLEAGELRLGIMQCIGVYMFTSKRYMLIKRIVQAYIKLKTPEAQDKGWQMMRLMDIVRAEKSVFHKALSLMNHRTSVTK